MVMAAPVHRPAGLMSGKSFGEKLRPNAHARGYGGRRWEAMRRETFRRDGYVCRGCGQLTIEGCEDEERRPHCDHIVPKPEGGDELSNRQTLCGTCHSKKTAAERRGGGAK